MLPINVILPNQSNIHANGFWRLLVTKTVEAAMSSPFPLITTTFRQSFSCRSEIGPRNSRLNRKYLRRVQKIIIDLTKLGFRHRSRYWRLNYNVVVSQNRRGREDAIKILFVVPIETFEKLLRVVCEINLFSGLEKLTYCPRDSFSFLH